MMGSSILKWHILVSSIHSYYDDATYNSVTSNLRINQDNIFIGEVDHFTAVMSED